MICMAQRMVSQTQINADIWSSVQRKVIVIIIIIIIINFIKVPYEVR